MTFDEAVREYQLRSSIGPLVQGMKLSPFVNVPQQEYDRVKFLNNLFYETINKLRQEYAPTVQMTKDKVKELNSIVHEVGDEFEQDELPDDESIRTTDKMIELESGFVLLKDLNVILHPETIKIVDE
ncbi:hypothetical protein [Leuconostoc mesenteroides]|uniref:hypothetical protein n=1 Tax=Leuconostoc mesenteroides TaxID=1245 RepID=UPI00235E280D|nr:hypothetical protein [Leuconostoc mesenteroides]